MRTFLIFISASFLLPIQGWADAVAEAERLYMDYCSVCHGERGDGNSRVRQGLNPPPRDFTQPGLAAHLSRGRMIQIIRDGKPGTAMVGWGTQLDEAQIGKIADFILHRFMGDVAQERSSTAQNMVSQEEMGKQIYATSCSVCHGEEGKGAVWGQRSLNPPPVNFTDPSVKTRLDRARMITSVTYGRPGSAMTAFGTQLSESEIAATVDYIRRAFMGIAQNKGKETSQPAASHAAEKGKPVADTSAPMPDGLAGDPEIGRAYYLQNCTACHGSKGDGEGPRAYFIFPKPRNFLSQGVRAAFNRPRLFAAIRDGVVGKEMPAWGKVLDEQTIAHITEYVYRAFIVQDIVGASQEK